MKISILSIRIIVLLFVILTISTRIDAGKRRNRGRKRKRARIKVSSLASGKQANSICDDTAYCNRWRDHCSVSKKKKGRKKDKKQKKKYNLSKTMMKFVRKRCPCTCDQNFRFAACCEDMGLDKECLPICKYGISSFAYLEVPEKCLLKSHIWVYCSAQGINHQKCCRKKGIPKSSPCYELCNKGKLPKSCTTAKQSELKQCAILFKNQMNECFERGGMPAKPHWIRHRPILESMEHRCKQPDSKEAECWFNPTKCDKE